MKLLLDAAAARFARNDIPLYAADGHFSQRPGNESREVVKTGFPD